jgi:hypothetical protein
MTVPDPTPDLRARTVEALEAAITATGRMHGDPQPTGDELADAVLAAVLPPHREMVAEEIALAAEQAWNLIGQARRQSARIARRHAVEGAQEPDPPPAIQGPDEPAYFCAPDGPATTTPPPGLSATLPAQNGVAEPQEAAEDRAEYFAQKLVEVMVERDEARADLAALTPGWTSPAELQQAYTEVLALCEAAEAERDRLADTLQQVREICENARPLENGWDLDPFAVADILNAGDASATTPGVPTYRQLAESHAVLLDQQDEWRREMREMGAESEHLAATLQRVRGVADDLAGGPGRHSVLSDRIRAALGDAATQPDPEPADEFRPMVGTVTEEDAALVARATGGRIRSKELQVEFEDGPEAATSGERTDA